MTGSASQFFHRGWAAFDPEPATLAWARAAAPVAAETLDDPQLRAEWLRCAGTWFAGVNALANDAAGAVPGRGVPPLDGAAVRFVRETLGLDRFAWDRAQVSICFPGYPQPWEGESEAAFRYRRDRDAAHVDGLLRLGPERRRHLGERHGFVLGLPLAEVPASASPLVVWEGSHEIMRRAFAARFDGIAPGDWGAEDLTDAYWAARREAFGNCPRVPVTVPVGGAYIIHRLALHGIAPWGEHAGSTPRMVAYFRPDPFPGAAPDWWLARP